MAKWFGVIGYNNTKEDPENPGVWIDNIVEQSYYGDVTSDYRKRQTGLGTNDDISLTNVVSIIADPYVIDNCSNMIYAEIHGTKWKITNVDVKFPRLEITIGGVYNGQ